MEMETETDLTENINVAVEAALELRKEHTQKINLLDDSSRVYLQVGLIKVPVVEQPIRKYIRLPHYPAGNDPDVCVFVKNAWPNDHIVRTYDDKIEYSIDHYKTIFAEHGVEGISAIMPVKQLRNEYGTYEMRRKLVRRFDVFLTDTTLLGSSKFTTAVGKAFSTAHKFPVGFRFPKPGKHDDTLKKRVGIALKTSYFTIKPHSNNYGIFVGVTSHTKEQLTENLKEAIKQIINYSLIPGGFYNIRTMYLKTDRSKAVPIYVSLLSKNSVPVPYVKGKGAAREPVEGEISTRPGMKVIVMPNGDVIVKKSEDAEGSDGSDSDSEEEDDEGFDDEDSDADVGIKKEKEVKKKKVKKEKVESEDEEDVAENAEQKYLSGWLDEIKEEEEEKVEEKQTKKGAKRKAEVQDSPAVGKKSKNVNKKGKKAKTEVSFVQAPKGNILEGKKEKKEKKSPKVSKKGKNLGGKQKKPLGKKGKVLGNNKGKAKAAK